MRADRLVTILLLLQARGRLTAPELAAELEVSERTARRDLEALAVAGIPVYAQPGRGGGWRLLGGARTDLSGLSAGEARALFLVAGSAAPLDPEARSALRKLVRALPETFRSDAERAASAIVLDPVRWGEAIVESERADDSQAANLAALRQAVVEGRQVDLGYVDRVGAASERRVSPLGLVRKGLDWYLLADTAAGQRAFLVKRVRAVGPTPVPAVRPQGFNLAEAWRAHAGAIERRDGRVAARVDLAPGILEPFRMAFGRQITVVEERPDGSALVELPAPTATRLAERLAGWGAMIRVVEPAEVRAELLRIGRELMAQYADAPAESGRPGDRAEPAPRTDSRPRG